MLNQRPRFSVSARRRRTVLSMLREARQGPGWASLSPDARLAYTVGGLICDPAGVFLQAQLRHALNDPVTVAYARALLTESGE